MVLEGDLNEKGTCEVHYDGETEKEDSIGREQIIEATLLAYFELRNMAFKGIYAKLN